MKRIAIEGYLTQLKLSNALRKIVGDAWRGAEFPVPGSRRRWDMAFSRNGSTTVVEYDGDEHYCNTLKIKVDIEKDQKAAEMGYQVVRIPYWIQLTNETLRHYFGLEAEVVQDFLHGFITTKILPASFCALGLQRFMREMDALPSGVRDSVVASIRQRAQEYVIPPEVKERWLTTRRSHRRPAHRVPR